MVWATAFDGSGSGINMQQFSKTTDGGQNWQSYNVDIGDLNLGISMIHAYNENIAWLVAYPRGANQTGGIFKTTDGGENWFRQNSANYDTSSSFANVVYFWDENTGFAQGDPINGEFELYVTDDGGNNWQQVPGANIPNPLGGEYGYTRQIEVVNNNVWFTTTEAEFLSDDEETHGLFTNLQLMILEVLKLMVIFHLVMHSGILIDNNSNVYKTSKVD